MSMVRHVSASVAVECAFFPACLVECVVAAVRIAGHGPTSIAIENIWEKSPGQLIVGVIATLGKIRHVAASVTIEKIVGFKSPDRVSVVTTNSVAGHVAAGVAVEIIVGLRGAGFVKRVIAPVSIIRHVAARVAIEQQRPLWSVTGP